MKNSKILAPHRPKAQLQKRRTLSAQVAEHICEQIRAKRLTAGAALGTEADLAAEFGVSRTVVREAIGHLRGLGVVSSRPGRGLEVAGGDIINTLSMAFAPHLASNAGWSELGHLRYVLEVGSIPLAVERANPDLIQRMRQVASEMYAIISGADGMLTREVLPDILKREIEFHELIFEAAGGEFAQRFHSLLSDYFHDAYQQQRSLPISGVLDEMRQHLQLVEAMEKGDVPAAVAVLRQHLQPLVEEEKTAGHETDK